MPRFLVLSILIIIFAFFQAAGFNIFGIKPNLALVAIIVASFFIFDIWEGLILILTAVLILKFKPVFGQDILTFSLIGSAAVIARKYLIWQPLLSCLIIIAAATLSFYLILSPSLVLSATLLKEMGYNIIFGALIFSLTQWLKKKFF